MAWAWVGEEPDRHRLIQPQVCLSVVEPAVLRQEVVPPEALDCPEGADCLEVADFLEVADCPEVAAERVVAVPLLQHLCRREYK